MWPPWTRSSTAASRSAPTRAPRWTRSRRRWPALGRPSARGTKGRVGRRRQSAERGVRRFQGSADRPADHRQRSTRQRRLRVRFKLVCEISGSCDAAGGAGDVREAGHALALLAVLARSRARGRQRPSPATVRATTHLRGSTARPRAVSARCTIGRLQRSRLARVSGGIAQFRPGMAAVREDVAQVRSLGLGPNEHCGGAVAVQRSSHSGCRSRRPSVAPFVPPPRRACATSTRLISATGPLSRQR
jgi:hypothetical protein